MHFIRLTVDNDKIHANSVKPKLRSALSRLGFYKHSKWHKLYTFDDNNSLIKNNIEMYLNQVFKEIIGCKYSKDGLDTVKIEYWDFDDLLLLTPKAGEYYMSKYLFSGKIKPNITVTYQSPVMQAYQKLVDEFNRR